MNAIRKYLNIIFTVDLSYLTLVFLKIAEIILSHFYTKLHM